MTLPLSLMLEQAASAPSAATTLVATQAADDRSQAFRPVEGGGVTQSGERLLVEAYAAIWLILLALLFVSWRKQTRIDARIAALEDAIGRARGDTDGKGGR